MLEACPTGTTPIFCFSRLFQSLSLSLSLSLPFPLSLSLSLPFPLSLFLFGSTSHSESSFFPRIPLLSPSVMLRFSPSSKRTSGSRESLLLESTWSCLLTCTRTMMRRRKGRGERCLTSPNLPPAPSFGFLAVRMRTSHRMLCRFTALRNMSRMTIRCGGGRGRKEGKE